MNRPIRNAAVRGSRVLALFLVASLCLAFIGASLAESQPLRVNVMPGNSALGKYPYTWPNKVLTIWGNLHGGVAPYTYTWDYGDGTPSTSGAVTNTKYIAVTHAYTTMGPKRAILTVTDAAATVDKDTVEIEVEPQTFQVQVNAAVENGLRWLYLQQYAAGYWAGTAYGGTYYSAPTAAAVLAFENANHLPINDYNKDIYAEYVQAGLNYLLTRLYVVTVPPQGAGDPEADALGNTDHNGFGIGCNEGSQSYPTPMVLMAIVGSGPKNSTAPSLLATAGPANVIGRTYRDIAVDMVDWCAWAQSDPAYGNYRGGWRYNPNYGSSDNSVSQWPTIGLEAAETNWGISAPAFVKAELQRWTTYSQSASNGSFGYDFPGAFAWPGPAGIATTGAGLCELAYAGVANTDLRTTRALGYLSAYWNHSTNNLNLYNNYAVAKGCRIARDGLGNPSPITMIGSVDWYAHYAAELVASQNADGGWPDFSNELRYGQHLNTAWSLLVLQQTIVGCHPVAVVWGPQSWPSALPLQLDGSHSYIYGSCPDQSITQWLWDFDKNDGVNWSTPDATGKLVSHTYILPPGVHSASFVATLRVLDNSIPPQLGEMEYVITISDNQNHPPVADAGGPYSARIGEMVTFDGTGSFDPDAPSGDQIVSYSWDLNGDGIFGDCTNPTCQNSWGSTYSGKVGLVVTDSHGATSDTAQSYVTIWTSRIDVAIVDGDVQLSKAWPMPGEVISIAATVHCDPGSDPVSNVRVRFYDGNPDILENRIGSDQVIASMAAGGAATVSVPYTVASPLPRCIYVRLDPDNAMEEYNESNNQGIRCIEVKPYEVQVITLPTIWYCSWVNSTPIGTVRAYIGSLPANYTAAMIDPASIRLNATIPIFGGASRVRPSMPGLTGSVLEVAFNRVEAIKTVGNPPSPGIYPFTITGQFTDGMKFVVTFNKRLDLTSAKISDEESMPTEYSLSDAYPNPFNPTATIEFGLPTAGSVLLEVYNVLGQRVRTLVDGPMSAGYKTVEWNGTSDAGESVSSGVYLYRLTAGDYTQTKKMMLLK